MRNIFVTTGLPYANGELHLGHMTENIQADIWVRMQKMRGNNCLFFGGDDSHGTPIMLSAQKQNTTPEELVITMKQHHERDMAAFYIDFDNFHTTHSEENRHLAETIYNKLNENGDIIVKEIEQAYDEVKEMFLPDRFIKGKCPCCKTPDQYGDSCEKCGATYSPKDLIDPISRLSDSKPILKKSEHHFFHLAKYTDIMKSWITDGKHLQSAISNKLVEWFKEGLHDWDISRDAPYFGFEIPGAPGKYLYVWMDAPMGYIASFHNWCSKHELKPCPDFWHDETTEVYHFVGKDIIYFHALFWPAVLHAADLRMPSAIFAHGFLNINGAKMSKSKGTFILASQAAKAVEPELLRYFIASKLDDSIDDIDLNIADFAQKINSDLVGKVVNIASRSAKFINKDFSDQLANTLPDQKLFDEAVKLGDKIADLYEARKYSEAVREIMGLADRANQYVDSMKPWQLIKDEANREQVHGICTLSLNLFRLLIIYLKPILPKTAEKVESFLNIEPLTWQDSQKALLDHKINKFTPLMQRIKATDINAALGLE